MLAIAFRSSGPVTRTAIGYDLAAMLVSLSTNDRNFHDNQTRSAMARESAYDAVHSLTPISANCREPHEVTVGHS